MGSLGWAKAAASRLSRTCTTLVGMPAFLDCCPFRKEVQSAFMAMPSLPGSGSGYFVCPMYNRFDDIELKSWQQLQLAGRPIGFLIFSRVLRRVRLAFSASNVCRDSASLRSARPLSSACSCLFWLRLAHVVHFEAVHRFDLETGEQSSSVQEVWKCARKFGVPVHRSTTISVCMANSHLRALGSRAP